MGWIVFIFLFLTSLLADAPVAPIPNVVDINPAKAEVGKLLFYDPQLSADGSVSCANCHQKRYGGSNGKRFGVGVYGRETKFNVPSIYNLRFQFVYGWKSKTYDLRKKIEEVMKDPTIMDANFTKIYNYIASNDYLRKRFLQVFDRIDKQNVIEALYSYLLRLNSVGAKFDRYLEGKATLSAKEARGFLLFKEYGCIACHNGKALGGHLYFEFGYFTHSQGRVKCPSLRNVALTAPYFYDGSISNLKEAIREMAKGQLGRDMKEEDIEAIEAFLKTLTGKVND